MVANYSFFIKGRELGFKMVSSFCPFSIQKGRRAVQASGFSEALPVISFFLSSKTNKRMGILSCNLLHEVWFPRCDRTFCGPRSLWLLKESCPKWDCCCLSFLTFPSSCREGLETGHRWGVAGLYLLGLSIIFLLPERIQTSSENITLF